MTSALYWFRTDLRLQDNPALLSALRTASSVIPVFVHPDNTDTPWGFERVGPLRQQWLDAHLDALRAELETRGTQLIELYGAPAQVLPSLLRSWNIDTVFCEYLAAPEEQDDIQSLREQGFSVHATWQTTLMDRAHLPFQIQALPDSFTPFRQALIRHKKLPALPAPALPDKAPWRTLDTPEVSRLHHPPHSCSDARAPLVQSPLTVHGRVLTAGTRAAQDHLSEWFSDLRSHDYKQTRNALDGWSTSTKFSLWMAMGALSARQAAHALQFFEQRTHASDSSGWILFELLWRDYFHFLHLKYGRRLYAPSGLKGRLAPAHNTQGFTRWREGRTGHPLIDAGMNELRATGFLSNRMRQIVASYCINDLGCDWRAGAAWFEHCLLDYDVCSNTGNWLYIAGLGTDPRGGRRFNPDKQAAEYDPRDDYQRRWSSP